MKPVTGLQSYNDAFRIAIAYGIHRTAPGRSFLLTNLQSEKVPNRKDFKERRCVIPVDGFYE